VRWTGGAAAAGGVEHFENDEARTGSDAGARAAAVVAAAGDDAGDVRPVPHVIKRISAVGDGVEAMNIIDNAVDGFYADDADELRSQLFFLKRNPELAESTVLKHLSNQMTAIKQVLQAKEDKGQA
jgi:hypothetical protein